MTLTEHATQDPPMDYETRRHRCRRRPYGARCMTPPYQPPPPPPPPVPTPRERLDEERRRQARITGWCIVGLTILAAIFMLVIIGKVI